MFRRDKPDAETFRNLYLLAAIRGGYELNPRRVVVEDSLDFELLHTPDWRWGIPLPWGPCDSGTNLESAGDVSRAWTHVDLRLGDEFPSDVPISGLLRVMWDALEPYGVLTLTGVDVSAPLACAGERMGARVLASPLRNVPEAVERPHRVLLQAVSESSSGLGAPDAILETLREFAVVSATLDDVPFASYPPSPNPHPFVYGVEHPWGPADTNPFRAEVALPVWSIDDAAWLAEVVCLSCSRAGVSDDVQVAVRLLGGED
jgi:hypothetical protein